MTIDLGYMSGLPLYKYKRLCSTVDDVHYCEGCSALWRMFGIVEGVQ